MLRELKKFGTNLKLKGLMTVMQRFLWMIAQGMKLSKRLTRALMRTLN